MAYFSNGDEGMLFYEECETCPISDEGCPIALAQLTFNYKACNNEIATDILEGLVRSDGTCEMKKIITKFIK